MLVFINVYLAWIDFRGEIILWRSYDYFMFIYSFKMILFYYICCRLCVSSFGSFTVFLIYRPIPDLYAKIPALYAEILCYLSFWFP